jgi:hypothetical protein
MRRERRFVSSVSARALNVAARSSLGAFEHHEAPSHTNEVAVAVVLGYNVNRIDEHRNSAEDCEAVGQE